MTQLSAYGTWTSPIDATQVAAAAGSPTWVDTHDGQVWWTESRPEEGGRLALMRSTGAGPAEAGAAETGPVEAGPAEEMLAAPWNVRNRVHEYGGRPWCVVRSEGGDRVAFTHWDDQRIYLLDPGAPDATPVAISPEPDRPQGYRYADLQPGATGEEVWCVRETVTGDTRTDVRRDLVALPITGTAAGDPGQVRVLAASHHFLSGPKISPDGRNAAWLGWEHPAMPWDGTEVCVAEVGPDGTFGEHRVLAGGPAEAVCQLEWDSPDALCVLTDPDGWWNLVRVDLTGRRTNLHPCAEELGGPLWTLGSRWFARLGDGRYAISRAGRLAVLDESAGTLTDVATPLPTWSSLTEVGGDVAGIAAGPASRPAVVRIDPATGETTALTAQPAGLPDSAYLPVPEHREFTGPDGQRIPAYVFAPRNPDFAAPGGDRPPLLVVAHGGPTGHAGSVLNLSTAYFTSRGIAVVAVNYGGSTGYGREFRERLRGQWGVVDVEDCAAVAETLAAEGFADQDRLAIRGGSAGGFTTAAALTAVSTFACGAASFPVIDLLSFAGGETHDFESQYLTSLVGPLPEARAVYAERSPSNRVEKLAGPILFLQGLEDEICPPEQSQRFVAALAGRGIPHAYLGFPGEQHGFRRAETIQAALEAELSFYGQVFGFTPPGVARLELTTT